MRRIRYRSQRIDGDEDDRDGGRARDDRDERHATDPWLFCFRGARVVRPRPSGRGQRPVNPTRSAPDPSAEIWGAVRMMGVGVADAAPSSASATGSPILLAVWTLAGVSGRGVSRWSTGALW